MYGIITNSMEGLVYCDIRGSRHSLARLVIFEFLKDKVTFTKMQSTEKLRRKISISV